MGDEHMADTEIDVPPGAIQIVDPEVVKKLPEGTVVDSISAHGASFWTRTACLHATIDDKPIRYFLKTAFGERGRKLMLGEFISMTAIHSTNPALAPKAIAHGTYHSLNDVHFLICEFRNMRAGLPSLSKFPAMMAELHKNSTSPNGQFGFEVPTFHGNTEINHGWSPTWEEYFVGTTRDLLQMEQRTRGTAEEIEQLAAPFFEKVIPRLLRPLETGDSPIRPCLIHGDLWHGNAAMDADTGEPVIFDAGGFYAHNEYADELAVWRQPWNEIGAPYRAEYCKHFPPSHPAEDFEDRGLLYATRVNILDSILYKQDTEYRQRLIAGMRTLVQKFPDVYEG